MSGGHPVSAPQWEPVDNQTADLLSLVADEGHPSADREWAIYLDALHTAAATPDSPAGVIKPNTLRRLVRGRVAPRRIGAFASRAARQGVVIFTGEWQTSDDTEGGNAGRPMRVYRLAVAS